MNDGLLLAVGILVFSLMLVGIILTVFEFRKIPRRQPPVFKDVAYQAQPNDPKSGQSAPAP